MPRPLWFVLSLLLLAVVGKFYLDSQWLLGTAYLVVAVAIAWFTSPFRGRGGTTQKEVREMADDDPRRQVVIYWRPGCGYCARLRASLGKDAKRATWVNIWDDKEGADYVRRVNDGNEIVPTAVLDGIPVTNPSPELVRERLEV